MRQLKALLLVAAVATLVLSACAPVSTLPGVQPAAPHSSAAAAGDNPLAGTSWMLTELNGAAPLAEATVTLRFEADGSAGGNDGCNSYFTTYTVDGDALAFGVGGSTMMACAEPIMAQAGAYQAALASVTTFTVAGGALTLNDASGAAVAVFEAQSSDLAGSAWEVTNYNNGKQAVVGLLADTVLTAEFGADGAINGSAGCNTFRGSYTVAETSIAIGPLATTRKMCPTPEGVMEQEAQFLAALESAATYRIDGNTLELRTTDDALAVRLMRAAPTELAGTTWEITNYNNGREAVVGPLADSVLTAEFGADGTVSGSAGCNRFSGGYTVDGAAIAIGPLVSTMMMCETPAGVMEQEAELLAALESAATYRIEGNNLELRTADDALAVWMVRAEPAAAVTSVAAVTGNVVHFVRMGLPDDAIVVVSIHNKQLADAPPEMTLLGEQTIVTAGSQSPIPFAVEYDPAAVQEGSLYSVGARITDGAGKLLFVSTTVNPVITLGNPTENVEVLVDVVQ